LAIDSSSVKPQPAKRALNSVLRRAGYEIRRVNSRQRSRPPDSGSRLLTAPAFVMCSVRSGSTLLRVLLNSHSQICAPHEIALRDLVVAPKSKYAEKALGEVDLDASQLEYVLWDWVLQRELEESGKNLLVKKTPSDVFLVDRIVECWPDARLIFLLRHPGAIARSRRRLRPQDSEDRNVEMVLRYCNALEGARSRYPGITVRYEDLVADPARVTRQLCSFLGVEWEPTMLDYGRFGHGRYRSGLGDWKDKIKSGQVQDAEPPPVAEEIPPPLRAMCETWGYASRSTWVPSSAPS
jgi:hypothetical protein